MSDIQTLMRNANPVPDAAAEFGQDDLDALLLLTRSRSTEMDAKELTRAVEKEPRNKRSGWYAAAAAFALVVLVIGSVVLLNRGTDPEIPPATTPPTTQAAPSTTGPNTTSTEAPGVSAAALAVLDAYIAAVASGDEAALRDVLTPGLVRTSEITGTQADLDKMILEAQVRQVRGSITELENCRPSGDRIQCSMVVDGPVERALYPFQLRDNYWFTISGGQIVGMEAKCAVCTPGGQVEAEVRAWVATFDPDAAAAMAGIPDYAFSVEGGLAWLKYAPLWRASSNDGSLDAVAFMLSLSHEVNGGNHQAAAEAVIAADQFVGEPDLPQNVSHDERFRAKFHMWAELGSEVTVSDCSTNSSGFTRCTLSRTSEREPMITDEPERWTIRLRIADGNLTFYEQAANRFEPYWQELSRVEEWLIANHNDVYMAAFFSPTDGPLAADLREEYMQLWIDAGRP